MDSTDKISGVHNTETYFNASRSWGMSLVFILPLIVLYQVGIVQSGSRVRNLAEVWMTGPIAFLGVHAATVVNVLLLAGVCIALWRMKRTGILSLAYAVLMLLESLIYAFLLFGAVGIAAGMLDETLHNMLSIITAAELFKGIPQEKLLLAIGAGVYEELLFRVIMIGGLYMVFRRFFGCSRFFCLLFLLLVSSLLFSAAHHIGYFGEPFNSYVFIFRALCGILLGLIYILRGPGIPVMTHAIYNVMVLITLQ